MITYAFDRYKVYGQRACQINTPVDTEIAQYIARNLSLSHPGDTGSAMYLQRPIKSSMDTSYLDTLERVISKPPGREQCPRFVYTPMHGVGGSMMVKACGPFGHLKQMTIVPDQAYPDPDFPTVKFPNPEEDGALDLAFNLADREGIRLILANDPDADRFAAAEKVGNGWHRFTGDEMGILLAEHLMTDSSGEPSHMITTAVSSARLSVVASKRGIQVEETLTGFKWIAERTLALEAQGKKVSFGYEEALGYMFPNVVYDKDGITAAIVFLQACKKWRSSFTKLQQLNEEHGYFETANHSIRLPNTDDALKGFENYRQVLRDSTNVAGRAVSRCRDLFGGYDSDTFDKVPKLPHGEAYYMITCWLAPQMREASEVDQGVRMTIRASGTEAKIKLYIECRASSKEAAQSGARRVLKVLTEMQ